MGVGWVVHEALVDLVRKDDHLRVPPKDGGCESQRRGGGLSGERTREGCAYRWTSPMAAWRSALCTAPVGLDGLQKIMSFVFSVMYPSSFSGSSKNPSSIVVGTMTGLAPVSATISG